MSRQERKKVWGMDLGFVGDMLERAAKGRRPNYGRGADRAPQTSSHSTPSPNVELPYEHPIMGKGVHPLSPPYEPIEDVTFPFTTVLPKAFWQKKHPQIDSKIPVGIAFGGSSFYKFLAATQSTGQLNLRHNQFRYMNIFEVPGGGRTGGFESGPLSRLDNVEIEDPNWKVDMLGFGVVDAQLNASSIRVPMASRGCVAYTSLRDRDKGYIHGPPAVAENIQRYAIFAKDEEQWNRYTHDTGTTRFYEKYEQARLDTNTPPQQVTSLVQEFRRNGTLPNYQEGSKKKNRRK